MELERESRVYWVKRQKEKDLLVFDAGHHEGTVYIYEHKESFSSKEFWKI